MRGRWWPRAFRAATTLVAVFIIVHQAGSEPEIGPHLRSGYTPPVSPRYLYIPPVVRLPVRDSPLEIERAVDQLLSKGLRFKRAHLMRNIYKVLFYLDAEDFEKVKVKKSTEDSMLVMNITVPGSYLRAALLYSHDVLRSNSTNAPVTDKNTNLTYHQMRALYQHWGSAASLAKAIFVKALTVTTNYVLASSIRDSDNLIPDDEGEVVSSPDYHTHVIGRIAACASSLEEPFWFLIRCPKQAAIPWSDKYLSKIRRPPKPLPKQTIQRLAETEAELLIHEVRKGIGGLKQVDNRGVRYMDDIVLATRAGNLNHPGGDAWKITNVTWTRRIRLTDNRRIVNISDPLFGARVNELRFSKRDGKDIIMKVLKIQTLAPHDEESVMRVLSSIHGLNSTLVKSAKSVEDLRQAIISSIHHRFKQRRQRELKEWFIEGMGRLTSNISVHQLLVERHGRYRFENVLLEHREHGFYPGDSVTITSLLNRPEFNGLIGRVRDCFDPVFVRYKAQTAVREAAYELRPENLMHLRTSPVYAPMNPDNTIAPWDLQVGEKRKTTTTSSDMFSAWRFIEHDQEHRRQMGDYIRYNWQTIERSVRASYVANALLQNQGIKISTEQLDTEVQARSARWRAARIHIEPYFLHEVRREFELDAAVECVHRLVHNQRKESDLIKRMSKPKNTTTMPLIPRRSHLPLPEPTSARARALGFETPPVAPKPSPRKKKKGKSKLANKTPSKNLSSSRLASTLDPRHPIAIHDENNSELKLGEGMSQRVAGQREGAEGGRGVGAKEVDLQQLIRGIEELNRRKQRRKVNRKSLADAIRE
ncbi:hypothetical protein AAMO2058_000796700 [Amorphochlora amoebiformis]